MAEKSVGRRATRRRSIGPGSITALGRIVNSFGPDGFVASDRSRWLIGVIHLATVTVPLSSSVSTRGLSPLVGPPCIRARPKAEHLLQDCEIFSSPKDKDVNPRPRCGDVAVCVARRVRILGEFEPRKPERARSIPANPPAVLADASGEHDRVHTSENGRHPAQGSTNGENETFVCELRARRASIRGLEDLPQISGDAGHSAKPGTLR
jgi:hypothetical protein